MNKKQLIVAWVAKSLIMLSIVLAVSSFSLAKPITNKPKPIHILDEGEGWFYEKVDSLAVNKRLKESAEELIGKGLVARFALYDIALPADAEEYADLNKNAILMITSVTHDNRELPISRVYLDCSGEKILLEKILSKTHEVKEDLIKSVFGEYREDSFYLLPTHLFSKTGELAIDWAKNRSGFVLEKFPRETDVDYIIMDVIPERQDLQLKEEALKDVLKREYSIEFKRDE